VSKYDVPGSEDAEFEPGSNRQVLRNFLHVIVSREMDAIEARTLVRAQDSFFDHFNLDFKFTRAQLQSMHRSWLGDVYPFAGKLREIDIAKDDVWFASSQFLNETFDKFGRDVLDKRTPCRTSSIHAAAEAIAEVH
jgi:cell filamentation protein